MMSAENRRSKKSPGCLLDMSGTIPEFSLKSGRISSGGGDPVVAVG